VGDRLDGWTFLFGVVPFSVHHLEVASIDDERRVLVSHEHGGLVRTWHHTLVVTEVDDASCRYEDRIDIDAGVFTLLVASVRLDLLPLPPTAMEAARSTPCGCIDPSGRIIT
jgi:hypothetical protein